MGFAEVLLRLTSLTFDFREIFGAWRFSTFSTWGNSRTEPDNGKGISSWKHAVAADLVWEIAAVSEQDKAGFVCGHEADIG